VETVVPEPIVDWMVVVVVSIRIGHGVVVFVLLLDVCDLSSGGGVDEGCAVIFVEGFGFAEVLKVAVRTALVSAVSFSIFNTALVTMVVLEVCFASKVVVSVWIDRLIVIFVLLLSVLISAGEDR